ncbi:MAG: tetrapyrrole methylase [Desulfovibrionaceae bacterium]|jgi:precorrin-4 methylase|nr:tetrapyrrole methylase [Desulfovibrionaceae bacterium]
MFKGLLVLLPALLLAGFAPAAPARAADTGRLYLVGLGVGDRDNMTLRAQKIVAKADVVFAMKRMLKDYAEMLEGKDLYDAGHGLFASFGRRGGDSSALEAQARKVIRKAVAEGKTVAILDGGDPMIYGPHTGFLTEFADLNPEVVPGVSSFNAANAALLRGVASGKVSHSVILTAAFGVREGYTGKDTLAELGKTQSTMVFFTMGMNLPEVVEQLKRSYPADTPIAIVSYAGYRDKEQVLRATLDTILERSGGKLPFEHLIYVGDFLK